MLLLFLLTPSWWQDILKSYNKKNCLYIDFPNLPITENLAVNLSGASNRINISALLTLKLALSYCWVYPVPKSYVTIKHCSIYADLISYLFFYISSNTPTSFIFITFSLHNPFPEEFLYHSRYWIFSVVPLLGALHETMFDC